MPAEKMQAEKEQAPVTQARAPTPDRSTAGLGHMRAELPSVGVTMDCLHGADPIWVSEITPGDAASVDGRMLVGDKVVAVNIDGDQFTNQDIPTLFNALNKNQGRYYSFHLSRGEDENQSVPFWVTLKSKAAVGAPPSLERGSSFNRTKSQTATMSGVGLLLRHINGRVSVKSIVEGGAAQANGEVNEGDILVAVDGTPVDMLDLNQVFDAIRGIEGTPVTLRLEHINQPGHTYVVSLTRKATPLVQDVQFNKGGQILNQRAPSPTLNQMRPPSPGMQSQAPVSQSVPMQSSGGMYQIAPPPGHLPPSSSSAAPSGYLPQRPVPSAESPPPAIPPPAMAGVRFAQPGLNAGYANPQYQQR
mmetsp:Transcript_9521/g.14934  ORF Transcript_9521/g.14934 Transcript_9521/m.14934 type:complete len:360 (+) Transcript_9521:127-1206(+)